MILYLGKIRGVFNLILIEGAELGRYIINKNYSLKKISSYLNYYII